MRLIFFGNNTVFFKLRKYLLQLRYLLRLVLIPFKIFLELVDIFNSHIPPLFQ